MISLESYLRDPCGTTSIPYWKYKTVAVPPNVKIVHQREMDAGLLAGYNDEPYFRLYHDLKNIRKMTVPEVEIVPGGAAIREFVRLINSSYTDISVTAEQMESYRHTPVYCPDLWLLLREKETNNIIAGGIADHDKETGEMSLEWVQVLPAFRGTRIRSIHRQYAAFQNAEYGQVCNGIGQGQRADRAGTLISEMRFYRG